MHNSRKERVPLNRLGQKIDGPGLHCPDAGRDVAAPRQENDGTLGARLGQGFLQTQAIELRHHEVDDCAARNGRIVRGKEFLWRRKGFGLVSAGLQKPRDRPKDSRIVVHKISREAHVAHHSYTSGGKGYLNPAAAEAEKPRSRPLSHCFEAKACRHEALRSTCRSTGRGRDLASLS